MLRLALAACAALMCLTPLAEAGERKRLGYGRLMTNDFFGDQQDRWRTGSVASSRVWGPTWTGQAPAGFGDLIELRLHGEIIAPENLQTQETDDRFYAGALSIGAHTHVQRGALDFALGGDLVFVGPGTGLDEFQDAFHDLLNIARPSDAVRDVQIDNSINPTVVFEAGRTFAIGQRARVRPFVETRIGVETLARAGFDWTYGQLGQSELLVRDPVSGQRYRAITDTWTGFSFVLGADIAHVDSSTFLPEDRGPALDASRERARAGMMWQGESGLSLFTGMTYLGKEFSGQEEGQVVGTIRTRFQF